jgi:uncharacterized protein
MRIAVIGAGIAGNSAAWALAVHSGHEVVVYEKEPRAGGHSHTVTIDYDGKAIDVDTGFIVYNELNYPNLTALFANLGVETKTSAMGFSVSTGGGAAEWAGRDKNMLSGLFARRRNLVSPAHLMMIREMFRFNRSALADSAAGRIGALSIGDYLKAGGYSRRFREEYLIPMGAAIWSMPPEKLIGFPAASFISFFENHRLLHWDRPAWRTVEGGSRAYVDKLTAPISGQMRLHTPVTQVRRHDLGVSVTDASGHTERFDQVIMACHTDESLALLTDMTQAEHSILSDIQYRSNDVWLHRDPALMPKRKAAWAAWNVLQAAPMEPDLTLTYWMNALQGIPDTHPLFVTLNPANPPREDLTFGRFTYSHPQYDARAVAAQKRLVDVQGHQRVWFCGAWTGHGFHEDGLTSGLQVAEALGASVPWRVADRRFALAAE